MPVTDGDLASNRTRNIRLRQQLPEVASDVTSGVAAEKVGLDVFIKRGQHNGYQAARRPHMMYSIYVRRFTTPLCGVREDQHELIR